LASSYHDRHYQSINGRLSAEWIYYQVVALQSSVVTGAKLSVNFFNHTWQQPSVIARYEPTTPTSKVGIVVTGSHIDTISFFTPQLPEPNQQPGADDCASGSSALWETLRVLVATGFIPDRPIEYHWYSAEEEGLYGSTQIANYYKSQFVSLISYLNYDQSGYTAGMGSNIKVGVMTDRVTTAATNLLKSCITEYSPLLFATTVCGYDCTDNAAWFNAGYPAAFHFEATSLGTSFPYVDSGFTNGTGRDTLNYINYTHVMRMAEIGISFVVELSLAP